LDLLLRGVTVVAPTVAAVPVASPARAPTTGRRKAGGAAAATPAAVPVDPRPVCQYGLGCYRKNPAHFAEFAHPGHPSNVAPPAATTAAAASPAPVVAAPPSAPVSVPNAVLVPSIVGPPYKNSGLFEFNVETHKGSEDFLLDVVLQARSNIDEQLHPKPAPAEPESEAVKWLKKELKKAHPGSYPHFLLTVALESEGGNAGPARKRARPFGYAGLVTAGSAEEDALKKQLDTYDLLIKVLRDAGALVSSCACASVCPLLTHPRVCACARLFVPC
jgi:hypothetical protein